MKNSFKLIISVGIPVAVGAAVGLFTGSSIKGWYSTLKKPSFNPPNWIFGPVWTVLYVLMGVAFYLIWKKESNGLKRNAVIFYFAQLVLNFFWSIIFFYAQQPGWALVDIILLWLLIVATIYWFSTLSMPAAWLMVPYILWVSFATALNFAIWKLN